MSPCAARWEERFFRGDESGIVLALVAYEIIIVVNE
jgi:hypothetical protein